ncbi:hypothetical protein CFAM422_008855 [Trichoderma lentiforme]|uniref:Uncharacterized protein n=1 Tax=Trichoderma lentiforme TaxID=1567552 RepID=A0A9P4XAX6_9HYPO|nr:hypothetical protein CFAM422_008855 [Trichoderma lentiforme]
MEPEVVVQIRGQSLKPLNHYNEIASRNNSFPISSKARNFRGDAAQFGHSDHFIRPSPLCAFLSQN